MSWRPPRGAGAQPEKQVAVDQERASEQAKEIATRTYVGSYLSIRARQIDGWAEQTAAFCLPR